MSGEAYEIGVTLALRDGVSEGIERARRQMVQLEQAISTRGVPVRVLRRAAEGWAGSDTPAVTREKTAQARQQSQAELDKGHASFNSGGDIKRAVLSPEMQIRTPVQGGEAPTPQQRPAAPETQAFQPAGQRRPDTSGKGQETRREPQPSKPKTVVSPSVFVRSSAPQIATPKQFALVSPSASVVSPVFKSSKGGAENGAQPSGLERAPSTDGSAARTPRTMVPSAGLFERRTSQSAAYVFAPNVRVDGPVQPNTNKASRDAAGGAAAPSFTQMTPAAPGYAAEAQVLETPSAPQSPSAAPLSQTGPMEGDVYLDGALVGRWVSKFLNREAGRAQAGPTGFDARRSRLLPGATVGG